MNKKKVRRFLGHCVLAICIGLGLHLIYAAHVFVFYQAIVRTGPEWMLLYVYATVCWFAWKPIRGD